MSFQQKKKRPEQKAKLLSVRCSAVYFPWASPTPSSSLLPFTSSLKTSKSQQRRSAPAPGEPTHHCVTSTGEELQSFCNWFQVGKLSQMAAAAAAHWDEAQRCQIVVKAETRAAHGGMQTRSHSPPTSLLDFRGQKQLHMCVSGASLDEKYKR